MPLLTGVLPGALEEFPDNLPSRMYLGESGIVLADGSSVDDFGCAWKHTGNDLWGPSPAPREQVGDRSYDHGQWDATRYYGPRVVPITGSVNAPDHASLHQARQRLNDAIGVSPFTARGTEPRYDSYATVRRQGEIQWVEINPRFAQFQATLFAPDPRLFSSLERSIGPIFFPSTVGGLTFPATWPATWDTITVSGSEILYNAGSVPIGLNLRVDGPVEWLNISLPLLGQEMRLVNPAGDLLNEGQWLSIDTDRRQILLNGDAGRRSWMTGDWLTVPAGTTTTLAMNGEGTNTTTVSGSYRAARI